MKAVFKREFKAYFNTPIGFVILAVFAIFEGMFFSSIYNQGAPNVHGIIGAMSTVAIFATPFITMRLFSEDRRQKVDQALLTAPVKVSGIVLGKLFAALALFALGFAPTVIFQLVVSFYVSANWLIYLYALIGILLLGCVMISIGMWISSLTESPIIAAALTFGVFLGVMFIGSYAATLTSTWFTKFASAISFIDRFSAFTAGIVNIPDLVYMLTVSAFFTFLTVLSVEKRRWA